MLRTDIKDLLAGFEERMKFVNIIRSIAVIRCPEDIRKMFKNDENLDILNNVIVMVLLYIKERTLSEKKSCTISDVAEFLDEIVTILPAEYSNIDTTRLATYIVINVLQNSGQLIENNIYHNEKESFKKTQIRLINETKSTYHLADEAFDFLYRSKEVATEFDYSVTRFKMQEYMKHKNYSEALTQSKELILKLRHMSNNFDDFVYKCKENITKVTVDEFEKITEQFRALINSEYESFEAMQKKATEEAKDIKTAIENGVDNEDSRKNLKDLCEIDRNLSIIISEQRSLINKKHNLSSSYNQILKNSFSVSRFERLHFEKDIITPMKYLDEAQMLEAVRTILYPLAAPEFKKMSSPDLFYQFEKITEETKKETGVDLTGEDTKTELIREKNQIQLEICNSFFDYMTKNEAFEIKQYIESLTKEELARWSKDKMLLDIIFTLFQVQKIDLEEIRNSDNVVTEPNGEINLLWAVNQLPKHCHEVKKISFTNLPSYFSYTIEEENQTKIVEMSNFNVEVNKAWT